MPEEEQYLATTSLLERIRSGDSSANAELMERLYADLRRLAAAHLRRERSEHTLQPTALVNEAYMRLFGKSAIPASDRKHFMYLAGSVMRQCLVDYARHRKSKKRGGGWTRVLDAEHLLPSGSTTMDVLDLDDALQRLEALDARQCRIVEMRFFAGYSEEEVAAVLDLSSRTIKREWKTARLWLLGQLETP